MNKRRIIVILVFVLIGATAGFIAFYNWNATHKNMEKAKADFKLAPTQLLTEFTTDENAANAKYLNKTIEVSGTITKVEKKANGQLTLFLDAGSKEAGIQCAFDALTKHVKTDYTAGQTINIKGICTGFLTDVVLERCVAF